MSVTSKNPLKLFYCYAHEDKAKLNALNKHLSILQRQKLIEIWYDEKISAGMEWEYEIDKHLSIADIILLLVSADFLASRYCDGNEMTRALQRHKEGTVRVIPIILRSVDWKGAPFSELQALPTGGRPVTRWDDVDDAYTDIAEGLRAVVEELLALAKTEEENGEEWCSKDEISRLEEELWSLPVTIVNFEKDIRVSAKEIDDYYKGKLLTWEIILAKADVVRDQQEVLIETYLKPTHRTRMLCLHGAPGAGKTTLAQRLAFEITQRSKQLLIQIDDNETGDVWYQLSKILYKRNVPCVILVDDFFRSNEVTRALRAFKTDLNVTIIATARSNEIPNEALRLSFLECVEVKAPSKDEKKRVMEKLHKGALSEIQIKRLAQANTWLVMMMELTSGEDLKTIVRDSIDRLEYNPRGQFIYRAYKYICYAGMHNNLSVPATLLLDAADASTHKLKNDPVGQGLIFYSEQSATYSTLHSVFAKHAFDAYITEEYSVVMDLIEALRLHQRSHRVFLCTLFFRSVKDQEALVKNVLVEKSEKMRDILNLSTHSELWYYWRGLYNQLCEVEKVALIENLMLNKVPEVSLDWIAYFKFLNEKDSYDYYTRAIDVAGNWFKENTGEQEECVLFLGTVDKWGIERLWIVLIEDVTQWLVVYQEDVQIRAAYLGLVSSRGKENHWYTAIEETTQWLKAHKEDAHVRAAYLELVEKRGREEHWYIAIESTSRWLKTHEDAHVRAAYLELVEKRGREEHWYMAIEETTEWLIVHQEESSVRAVYLGLVEKRGKEEYLHIAIEETTQWLKTHQDESNLRRPYLALVDGRGKEEHWYMAIEETTEWLKTHQDESNLRRPYLALVDGRGKEEHWYMAIEEMAQWLKTHQDESNLRRPHLALVDGRGKEEHWYMAIEEMAQWLKAHQDESSVRAIYLELVEKRGKEEHWYMAIEETVQWLKTHQDESSIRAIYLELVEKRGKEDQWCIAIESTIQWLQTHKDDPQTYKEDSLVRTAYLRTVSRRGTLEQRKVAIDNTTRWIEAHSRDAHRIINAYFTLIGNNVHEYGMRVQVVYLAMADRYGTKAYCKEVIEKTRRWIKAHAADFNVHIAYLRLVEKRGKEEHWGRVIEETREWLKTYEADFNVYIAYLRLVEKRGKEKHWNRAIADTREWLKTHEADFSVRAPYLGFVDRRGKEEHWYMVIEETREWLQAHPEDFLVRAPYLGFVDRRGKEEHWNRAIEETREWLQAHPEDFLVRAPYLGFVDRRGKEEHWYMVIEETRKWLQAHPEDIGVRAPYLGVVDRRGKEEHWNRTIEDTTQWLQTHEEDFNVRAPYLGLVARRGNAEQLETICRFTGDWVTHHSPARNFYLMNSYGNILLKLHLYNKAEEQFRHALNIKKSFVPARLGLAWSYYHQGKKEDAYQELMYSQRQVESGNEYPIAGLFLNLGRYWMFEGMADKSLECFQFAVSKDPSYYQYHVELGQAWLALKKYSKAIQSFKKARDILPHNISLEVYQDIDKLIAEALEHQKNLKPLVKRAKRKKYRKNIAQAR